MIHISSRRLSFTRRLTAQGLMLLLAFGVGLCGFAPGRPYESDCEPVQSELLESEIPLSDKPCRRRPDVVLRYSGQRIALTPLGLHELTIEALRFSSRLPEHADRNGGIGAPLRC